MASSVVCLRNLFGMNSLMNVNRCYSWCLELLSKMGMWQPTSQKFWQFTSHYRWESLRIEEPAVSLGDFFNVATFMNTFAVLSWFTALSWIKKKESITEESGLSRSVLLCIMWSISASWNWTQVTCWFDLFTVSPLNTTFVSGRSEWLHHCCIYKPRHSEHSAPICLLSQYWSLWNPYWLTSSPTLSMLLLSDYSIDPIFSLFSQSTQSFQAV